MTESTELLLRGDTRQLELTPQQQQQTLRAVCARMASTLRCSLREAIDYGDAAQVSCAGAFITAKRDGRLRSCCGALGRIDSVAAMCDHAAARTAADDPRFPAISPAELPYLDIDVSLLFGFHALPGDKQQRLAAVEVGRHGLQIAIGAQSGLLLPNVAVEQGWDAEQFLRQTCRKANLPLDAWEHENVRVVAFESTSFGGHFPDQIMAPADSLAPLTPAQMTALANHCRANLIAQYVGATPSYYAAHCWDGQVTGIGLQVFAGEGEPFTFAEFSLQPGMALQATLVNLTEAAVQTLRSRVAPRLVQNATLRLLVFGDVAMHGTAEHYDVGGLDPPLRTVLVMDQGHAAVRFDPLLTARQLVEEAVAIAAPRTRAQAQVYSLRCASTSDSFKYHSAPDPVRGQRVRAPGVAGVFYPGDHADMNRLLDEMLAGPAAAPKPATAVMTPHAGWRYSGRLAADVLRSVPIPSTIIALGPKHTRYGVPWAVTPHEKWRLPGGELDADPALARRLAQAIDGLQLDAAAHAREHAIEVELPIIARLAPNTKVVGVAMQGGDFEACQQFARGLAEVVSQMPERPLLLISSDMNHFAEDAENRRLDRLALDAMQTLDPRQLYDVVMQNQISMCGVLPAVVVMLALHEMNLLGGYEEVGYATSGETTGDLSRVVGYAGVRLTE